MTKPHADYLIYAPEDVIVARGEDGEVVGYMVRKSQLPSPPHDASCSFERACAHPAYQLTERP
jgi:hypothetical protein